MSLPPHEQAYDWQRFWIHFVCGALFGAVLGALFWFRNGDSGLSAWLCIGGVSLAVALLGGVLGDRFWERLVRCIGRWGWWV
jgi:hypothetical protein